MLMISGALVIGVALVMVILNIFSEKKAEQSLAVAEKLSELEVSILSEKTTVKNEIPDYILNPQKDLPIREIDGEKYIGRLSLHTLDLSLPVISELDSEKLELRDSLVANKDFLNEEFSYANQFAQADEIVIAAPYWDLSFPSLLKAYLEAISINGITFQYNEKGVPKGLCRAKRVIYITTAGGFIGDLNLGYDYVKAFFERILGIKEALFFKAEALDVYGTDIEAVLEESKKEIINTLG